jgi:3D (Asp-Asp-Asp) domain-containing protein
VTFRYVQREDAPPERTELASSVLRAPRPRIVGAGIATYDALAGYAKRGFESALRIAGAALHMIATAYTANCYECSGITKLGLRAGHGIVAVDPRIIPLGSKIFVPGYGRAVAGDTGGAIVGHRIDLGFDSDHAAIEFGRRAVTVYLLR